VRGILGQRGESTSKRSTNICKRGGKNEDGKIQDFELLKILTISCVSEKDRKTARLVGTHSNEERILLKKVSGKGSSIRKLSENKQGGGKKEKRTTG